MTQKFFVKKAVFLNDQIGAVNSDKIPSKKEWEKEDLIKQAPVPKPTICFFVIKLYATYWSSIPLHTTFRKTNAI